MKKRFLVLITMIFLISTFISQAYEETLPAGDDTKTDWSSSSVFGVNTFYSSMGNPIVKIASLKYEPYPVEPGSHFDLWLRIENIGEEKAQNAVIYFMPRGPFTIDGASKRTIGELGSRQSAVIKFENIKVSEDAVEGSNQLEFQIYMGGAYDLEYMTSKINVDVRSVSPLFEITVNSEPERIPQGGTATINVNLKNKDTSLLKDILIELDLPAELVPIGSTMLKKIQKISPNGEETLSYTVTASGDAITKAYSIPLTVSYSDEIGTSYSQTDTMGLLIGSEPDYYINLEESDTFSKNQKGDVVISISNTGPSDIKFLTIELLESDDFTIMSNSKTYIGNLEPDDYETAEFELHVSDEGDLPLNIVMEYRDNYNMKHSETHTVKLHSYTQNEISKYGLAATKSIRLSTIIAYLLGAIFVYLTYKNWRKERDIIKASKVSLATMIKSFFRFLMKIRWKYIKRIPRKISLFLYS